MGFLRFSQKLSYGVGHMLNDLCASIWFSYLLIYYHKVINFSNPMAGNIMLVGQVADAISTPLVGYESDRTAGFLGYGKRKTWHLFGSVCVALSFPFLFNLCISCSDAAPWAQFIYYAPFVVIFQIGWASTQISHLALIPELTPCEDERVGLNAIRYSFTVISNLVVYAVAWLLLDIHTTKEEMHESLDADDSPQFRDLAFIAVGIGILFTILFHVFTKEKIQTRSVEDFPDDLTIERSAEKGHMSTSDWFKEKQFYLIGFMYMCTRLVVNISQVYLPMFLTDVLNLDKQYIAIVPLLVYFSGFISSLLMRVINRKVGRKFTYFLGLLCIYGVSVWFWFIAVDKLSLQVFGAAILQGIGTSTILVTSLSMTADLINENTESGAFVYGAMSFTDKLSNGVAVVLIQQLHPCHDCCSKCEWYYRDIMVFVPGGVAVLAGICLLILLPQKIGHREVGMKRLQVCTEPPDLSNVDENAPLIQNVGINGPVDATKPMKPCANVGLKTCAGNNEPSLGANVGLKTCAGNNEPSLSPTRPSSVPMNQCSSSPLRNCAANDGPYLRGRASVNSNYGSFKDDVIT